VREVSAFRIVTSLFTPRRRTDIVTGASVTPSTLEPIRESKFFGDFLDGIYIRPCSRSTGAASRVLASRVHASAA
jgi:hypothetical protein